MILSIFLLGSAILKANAFGISIPASSRQFYDTRLGMATWSDSKAVKDYQNFLESGLQELEVKPDVPSVIIRPFDGMNMLAEALVSMGTGQDLVLGPDEPLPDEMGGNSEYPIYVALGPYHIEPFIQELSESHKFRNDDFIFFSGGLEYGNIEDVLRDYGYCRDTMTQVLITGMSMQMTGLGTLQILDVKTRLGTDAMGEEKWAGECTACGKWNGSVSNRFGRADVTCNIDFYRDWRRKMWERSMLDAACHLVGAIRDEPTTVAQVATYFESEVSDMLWEFSSALRGWKAVTLMYGFEERLYGAAETTGAELPCVLNDWMYPFIWGNKVFIESPMFLEYLWYAKESKGLLKDVDLPPKKEASTAENSIMRKGNMRADGVI
jgi:hypothetical protein